MKVTQSVSALALVSHALAFGPLPVGKTAALSLASAFLSQASVASALPPQRRSEEAGNGGLLDGLLGGGAGAGKGEAGAAPPPPPPQAEAGKGGPGAAQPPPPPAGGKGVAEAELGAAQPPPPPPKGGKGVADQELVADQQCDVAALHPDIDLAAMDQATLNAVVKMIAMLGPIDPAACEAAAVVDNGAAAPPPPPPQQLEDVAAETATDLLVDATATKDLAAEATATDLAAEVVDDANATETAMVDAALETADLKATDTAMGDAAVETAVAAQEEAGMGMDMGGNGAAQPEAAMAAHKRRWAF